MAFTRLARRTAMLTVAAISPAAALQPAGSMKHLHTQISRPLVMSIGPVGKGAVILGAANTLGFAISATTGVHYHLDLIGTGAFAVAAAATRGSGLTQGLSAAAVSIWSVKLASFLFYRVLQTKRDARLEGILSTTSGAFGFWAISFLWGWVVSLPHTVAAGVPLAVRPAFGPLHVAGIALFASGLTVETAADVQKWLFKQDPANKGLFCDVGLWKLSQHPNWVGNLLLWTGVLVLNAPTLLAPVTGRGSYTVHVLSYLHASGARVDPCVVCSSSGGSDSHPA